MKLTRRVYGAGAAARSGMPSGRQRLSELGLVVPGELVERGLVVAARVGLAERAPGLGQLGVDGDRVLELVDPCGSGAGVAQQQGAEQVERPRVLGVGGQRPRAAGARGLD